MAAIGMRHVVAAPLASEVHGSAPTYENGFVVGRSVSANLSWNRNDTPLYGEDTIAEDDNGVTGYDLDIGVTELVESAEEKLLGYKKVETSGQNAVTKYVVTGDSAPDVGLGFIQVLKRKGVVSYKAFWFYKVKFSRDSEEAETKEEKINWSTPTINGRGVGVYPDSTGTPHYRECEVFTTEAAAAAYLDGLAGISA